MAQVEDSGGGQRAFEARLSRRRLSGYYEGRADADGVGWVLLFGFHVERCKEGSDDIG